MFSGTVCPEYVWTEGGDKKTTPTNTNTHEHNVRVWIQTDMEVYILTIDAELLGDEVGQVLAVSFEAVVSLEGLPRVCRPHHDVGFFDYSSHYVCPVPFYVRSGFQTHVLGGHWVQSALVSPLGHLNKT